MEEPTDAAMRFERALDGLWDTGMLSFALTEIGILFESWLLGLAMRASFDPITIVRASLPGRNY